jgi:hypothetical protein
MSIVTKEISDKYGEIGLKVYSLIDGKRTSAEIAKQAHLGQAQFVDIIRFMEERGIVELRYND